VDAARSTYYGVAPSSTDDTAIVAAFGLSFALSMGELGATVMVYPPGWVTMPVAIFGLTDRGDIFSGAALTMILVVVTLALLIGLERAPIRSAAPR
jgi:2-aminoethylphosphonate transport system permease protein